MPPDVVLQALRHVWQVIESLHAPAALMGGLALSAWKHTRATRDVDLLVGIAKDREAELVQRFIQAGLRPKRQPAVLPLGRMRLVQFLYEPRDTFVELQVDVLLAACTYQHQALARRVAARLPGLEVDLFVLACEDLVLHKLLAGRIIDRADSAAMLRANRATLDVQYLLDWARQLGVTKELGEVWLEAFPNEPLPASRPWSTEHRS